MMMLKPLMMFHPNFQGTDKTLLDKLHQTHQNNKNYLRPKADINRVFGLNHFAGVVFYDSQGFLEKNRDTFSPDLLQVIQSSSNKFLSSLFQQDYYIVSFIFFIHLSRLVGKPTMWFPNRSDTNRPVQAQKRARSLKFRI